MWENRPLTHYNPVLPKVSSNLKNITPLFSKYFFNLNLSLAFFFNLFIVFYSGLLFSPALHYPTIHITFHFFYKVEDVEWGDRTYF